MRSVYVASKFENGIAVRAAHAILRSRGFEITFDWTRCTVDDPGYPHEHAEADFNGVANADLFLMIVHPGMKAAFVELGIALALRRPVFIVGDASCVFTSLRRPVHRVEVHETLESAVAAMSTVRQ